MRVANGLPDPTTIHWHGVAPRNVVDGVPGVTRSPIAPGADFMYEFTVPDPGTYWFHPHVGVQLDRGLSAPLIVEDPDERPGPTAYCGSARGTTWSGRWCSTIGSTVSPATPDEQLAALRAGGGSMGDMHGSPTGIRSSVLGGDARDVAYPHYLVNRGG